MSFGPDKGMGRDFGPFCSLLFLALCQRYNGDLPGVPVATDTVTALSRMACRAHGFIVADPDTRMRDPWIRQPYLYDPPLFSPDCGHGVPGILVYMALQGKEYKFCAMGGAITRVGVLALGNRARMAPRATSARETTQVPGLLLLR
jgi:hypothetical protein